MQRRFKSSKFSPTGGGGCPRYSIISYIHSEVSRLSERRIEPVCGGRKVSPGHLTKYEVRARTHTHNADNKAVKDSGLICKLRTKRRL
jgi:hypothetical protein